jgi:pimeloyl-ACP methyl ester carboxylesterase
VLSTFVDGTLFGERIGAPPLKVLALHGWGRTHRDFDAVLIEGVPSVALDLPGFGATPEPITRLSSDDYARLIEPILDEAPDGVVLVGHSHGGRVALRLAARRPELVAGLVLVGAPVLQRLDRPRPSRALRWRKALRRAGLLSEARLEAFRDQHGSADYRAAHGVMRDTLVTVINESFEEELRGLRCPVRLVWGSDDHDVPVSIAERALELLTENPARGAHGAAELSVLGGVGHLVPTQAPEALIAAIDELVR